MGREGEREKAGRVKANSYVRVKRKQKSI